MNPPHKQSPRLTLSDLLAIAFIWGMVAYGISAKPAEEMQARATVAACG
jgi:hypothetical protein